MTYKSTINSIAVTVTAAAAMLLSVACSDAPAAPHVEAPTPISAKAPEAAPRALEDTKAERAEETDEEAAVEKAEPTAAEWQHDDSSTLEVVSDAFALDVINRVPRGVDEVFSNDVGEVYAHLTVRNMDGPAKVKMVWKRDGEISSTVVLPVGVSPRWRTWSKKTLRAYDVGDWSVEVYDDANDELIHTFEFEVFDAFGGGDEDEEYGC